MVGHILAGQGAARNQKIAEQYLHHADNANNIEYCVHKTYISWVRGGVYTGKLAMVQYLRGLGCQESGVRKGIGLVFAALLILYTSPAFAEKEVPQLQSQVQLSYAPLVKKSAPAVVSIFSKKVVKVKGFSPFSNDPFFGQFFEDKGQLGVFGLEREKIVNSLGSGVIVRQDGLIISNKHVVGDNTEIKVVLGDKREFEADVVLTDQHSDLAVIRLRGLPKGETLPYLELDDSDQLEVGDIVLAIGNPFGVGQTVTSGIVSALARTNVNVADYQYFIQTDAAINPGNSGGALVDMQGKVVGINTAIFTQSGGSQGIGFATPSNMVKVVMNAATHGGKIVRPWLGLSSQDVTQEIADSLGLKRPMGVLVKSVYKDSAAARGGIKVGDVIAIIDGKEIEDNKSLRFRIATYQIGQKAQFRIIRDGEEKMLSVEMLRPQENPPRDETKLEGNNFLSGLVVSNLSPALADELDIRQYEGVIVTGVWGNSPAKRIGMGTGDIILEVNGTKIESVKQLKKILSKIEGSNLQVNIQRGDQVLSVNVR